MINIEFDWAVKDSFDRFTDLFTSIEIRITEHLPVSGVENPQFF